MAPERTVPCDRCDAVVPADDISHEPLYGVDDSIVERLCPDCADAVDPFHLACAYARLDGLHAEVWADEEAEEEEDEWERVESADSEADREAPAERDGAREPESRPGEQGLGH
jgi:hypothetical protein